MDMFFQKNGMPFDSYFDELNKKYLIGSFKNPHLLRINFILERHKLKCKGSSYLICSNSCDYISPVGGNIFGVYEGCQNLLKYSQICNYCGAQFGSTGHLHIDNPAEYTMLINPESKIFKPD
jgi:hypothetical protein